MLTEKNGHAASMTVFFLPGVYMVKIIFLTEKFYNTYSSCSEIERKETRPYIRISITIDGVLWAVPLRSHISHKYVIWTDKANGCGIDFSKAVVIEKPDEYISSVKPHIRPAEFEILKNINNYTVEQKLRSYIKTYKRAKQNIDQPRNRKIVECSALQYFEQYL